MPDFVVRRSLAALTTILVIGLLVLGSVPAGAHAALVGTDPADGSSMAQAPRTITFTFNENIGSPAYVVVKAPDGSSVDVPKVRAVDQEVTATVAASDQRGTYSASYRVVSADGHPVSGTIGFDVTSGRTVDQVQQPTSRTFLHRHGSHVVWGVLAALVAIGLLLAPLRRRHDADRA